MNDAKGLESLIRQAYEKSNQNQKTLTTTSNSATTIKGMDLENAIAWIQQARSKESGKGDVSLEEKERTLTLEYFDNSIEQWKSATEEDPNNDEWKKSFETAISNKKQYQFNQLESLVQRYPNDYGYRYELGLLFFEDGNYDQCLQHFQLAQRNAKSGWMQFSTLEEHTVERDFMTWQSNSSMSLSLKFRLWMIAKKTQFTNWLAVMKQ